MPRKPREECESQIYHVVQRGVGQQILFEDDEDRRFFLELATKHLGAGENGSVLAWCLMSNHTHLLIHLTLPELSKAMKAIGVSYARYFNDRYGRSGHLFQDRFASEAVKDDVQFMVTVRYIHANPAKAGISAMDEYRWSSYLDFIKGAEDSLVDKQRVLEAFGDLDAFRRFHEADTPLPDCLDIEERRPRPKLTESEALEVASDIIGSGRIESLKAEDRRERNHALRELKAAGLSVRQMMRITGIPIGVISRACNE